MTEDGYHAVKFTLEELRHLNASMNEWANPNCTLCSAIRERIVKAITHATGEKPE